MTNIYALTLLLGAVSVGMFNMMKIVEMKNAVRNLVLNITKEGKEIAPDLKLLMINNEFRPMTIGVCLYLLLFAVACFSVPLLLQIDIPDKFSPAIWPASVLAGCLGGYALYVDATLSYGEIKRMKKAVAKELADADQGNGI
jgi:hypothetical protein